MSSYGKEETLRLIKNLESQLGRLVEQLHDLELCRDELDEEEYVEAREDTMEQLKELNRSLAKLINGDITLTSSLESMQMATRAAISQAFKTPDVIKLFSKKDPQQLRLKLLHLEQDGKLNKSSEEHRNRQKAEILTALRQLGDKLSPTELQFLENYSEILNALENIEFVELTNM